MTRSCRGEGISEKFLSFCQMNIGYTCGWGSIGLATDKGQLVREKIEISTLLSQQNFECPHMASQLFSKPGLDKSPRPHVLRLLLAPNKL